MLQGVLHDRSMRSLVAIMALMLWPALALAQTQQQLDNSFRFGAIATVGPLCGLRDLAWAADLQRAELRAMGVNPEAPDPAQRELAGRADSALSYAQDEALEDFAEAPPEASCGKLAHNPDLAQADGMVAAFRAGAGTARLVSRQCDVPARILATSLALTGAAALPQALRT